MTSSTPATILSILFFGFSILCFVKPDIYLVQILGVSESNVTPLAHDLVTVIGACCFALSAATCSASGSAARATGLGIFMSQAYGIFLTWSDANQFNKQNVYGLAGFVAVLGVWMALSAGSPKPKTKRT